jgi:sugar-specific transcriptional regulator TrmB
MRRVTTGSEQLTALGLTTYEAKAYLALLRRDSFAAADAARVAGVPRQRIYDVLATLVEKGLAIQRPGTPAKYAAVPPELAIERLLANRRSELEELEHDSRKMIEALKPAFAAGQKERDPLEYIEVLRDKAAINERFEELQEGIESEILVFTKPPYATPAQENVEGLAVSSTRTAKSIYELSALDDAPFADGIRRYIAAGEEARFVPELPLKLVIIDETIVMFGMEDPVAGSTELTIMVVEHRALARILKIAFEAVWANAITLEAAEAQAGSARVAKSA